MNTYRHTARRAILITPGSRVAFTEGLRIKFGTVLQRLHDHYRIACDDGETRRILHEKCEGLTTTEAPS